MKQRISALDLQLLAAELREHLEGYRLNNIYNTADSNRQFLLKFIKPDSKFSVVVDCGLRIHITDFERPIPPAPSGFVVKLRKHLKSKRLTALRQVKNDRIIVFQFADGLFYLVLEFFSAGNVILLDENRKILSLQRIVHEHENKVGQLYGMFDDALFGTEAQNVKFQEQRSYQPVDVSEWLREEQNNQTLRSTVLQNSVKSKKKASTVMSIHKLLLSKKSYLSSDLISNNLKARGINPSTPCLEFLGEENELCDLLNETEKDYKELLENEDKLGYILAKRNPRFNPEKDDMDLEFLFETFHPFKPLVDSKDIENTNVIKIDGEYNKTLDKFFSTIESSKYALRIQQQEQVAQKKLEDARLENQKKIDALLNVQSMNEQKGNIIIEHANLVEEAKSAVQGLLHQQMDWNIIEKLIKSEQAKSNRVAQLISLPLNLKENKIDLMLPLYNDERGDNSETDSDTSSENISESADSDSDSDIETDTSELSDFETEESHPMVSLKQNIQKQIETIKVTIDLNLSAYANASQYFNVKKSSAEKQKKVEQNVKKAMKNIEERIDKQLKKKLRESHDVLKRVRPPYFFEKFFWFISSEGFLVLMGRSPQDTDQIFSKYIEEDDIYMTNTFGSNPVWVKNPDRTEIPPNTLMQAGIFCMSASEAWSKKISSSPSWCFAKNISKFSDFDNSVLPPGLFHIKKESSFNSMPSSQLVMGFAFLWKIKTDDNSDENDRRDGVVEEDTYTEDKEFKEPGKHEMEEMSVLEDNNTMLINAATAGVLEDIRDEKAGNSSENIVRLNVSANDEEFEIESTVTANNVVSQMKKNVRGKKGKLKKIQSKYADQDEEERQLRLQALGTLKGVEKQELKKQEELARQQNREFRKAKREKQKEKQALKFTKNEKVKIDFHKFAKELKPKLNNDDEVIDLVPVFAPWPALQKYKYKVKIQPGNAKKTKTLSEILHYFNSRNVDLQMNDKEMDWPKEHEIIKHLKPQDLVLSICADKLKVTLPGQSNKPTQKAKGKPKKKKS